MNTPLIGTGSLTRQSLNGKVVIVTGAGRGIGYETARALAWLGASVILAEIDPKTGKDAEAQINREMGQNNACFIRTDVGDEGSVNQLAKQAIKRFGKVDVVFNNATVFTIGAVVDVPIQKWDANYRVNLRGPVLMARAFLPEMIRRKDGVFVLVSSVGEAYMGAYESFKAGQVHLARTLDAELQDRGVIVFTIGPGLVHTPGAEEGVKQVAKLYGKTEEEFFAMTKDQIISVEAAGAGFAAAVALAERYRGQEIYSKLPLVDAGIAVQTVEFEPGRKTLNPEEYADALKLCRQTRQTIAEQSEGWKQRPLFERQWVIRDFKQNAGMPVEQWLEALDKLTACLEKQDLAGLGNLYIPLDRLVSYFQNMQKMAKGYIKDPRQLEEYLAVIQGWQDAAEKLTALVHG